jgi:uncharacterized protein with LGFP repeats
VVVDGLGTELSRLPNERYHRNRRGSVSHFQGGDIYYSAGTGANEVQGAILARYAQMGGPATTLGFPTTDESPTADGLGRYNWFQNGAIHWSPGTGAHAVVGAIYAKWEALNWEIGGLGYPISEVAVAPNGDRSIDFQHGRIILSAEDGIARETIRIDGIPGGSPQDDNWSCGPNSAAVSCNTTGTTSPTTSFARSPRPMAI